MKIVFFVLSLLLGVFPRASLCQSAKDCDGSQEPLCLVMGKQCVVLLEVLPDKGIDCAYPITTALFEMPVTPEFFCMLKLGQEITSWSRSWGEISAFGTTVYRGHGNKSWRLVVRDKRIMENIILTGDAEGDDTVVVE